MHVGYIYFCFYKFLIIKEGEREGYKAVKQVSHPSYLHGVPKLTVLTRSRNLG
jgi:hypothetical protein